MAAKTAAIEYMADWEEYVVLFHGGGTYLQGEDYHTDCPVDAVETAMASGAITITSSNAKVKQALQQVMGALAYD